jgi:hypothetical protein
LTQGLADGFVRGGRGDLVQVFATEGKDLQVALQGPFRRAPENGDTVDIPSYLLKSGDMVSHVAVDVTPKEEGELPAWIRWDKTAKSLKVEKMPTRDEIQTDINEQLIVEYYSR